MMTFKSGKLVLKLDNLKSRFAGRRVAARITVPEDLDWWFYQEFGTATHFDQGTYETPPSVTIASIPPSQSSSGYTIAAKYGSTLRLPVTMRFPDPWEGPSVHHPGVPPKAFIRRILPNIHKSSSTELARALVDGNYDPDVVQETLLTEIMPEVLTAITTSMAAVFHDSEDRDTPGKLGSLSPADAFESAASIIDSSG